jgi:hypothetical protein
VQLEDYLNFLAPNDIPIKNSRICLETILYDFLVYPSPVADGLTFFAATAIEEYEIYQSQDRFSDLPIAKIFLLAS